MTTSNFDSFPEKKDEIKEYIDNSDILPWSKKFLLKKIEEYKNNDWKIDQNEIKNIKILLRNYDNLEDKYQKYKKHLKKNYSSELQIEQKELLVKIKNSFEKIELNMWQKSINKAIDKYLNIENNNFIYEVNDQKSHKKENSILDLFKDINKWILLWKITEEKWIIKLLSDKWINYYNIKSSIKYVDISWYNRKYNSWNIESWSKLIYEKIWNKHLLKIKPVLLVQKEEFEKEVVPWTNKLLVDIIKEWCEKYWIDSELYMSLIGIESSFWTKLKSSTWYIWYSMLRKDTSIAELLRLKLITKKEAELAMKNNWKTKENIIAWIKYFALLYEKFKWYKDRIKLSLAAYNWWPTKIKNIANNISLPKNKITFKHIVNSGKLSSETEKYPNKVLAIVENFYNKKIV